MTHNPSLQQLAGETFVVELNLNQKVGTDQQSVDTINALLEEYAGVMEMVIVGEPATHVSPKFGMSGWVGLMNREPVQHDDSEKNLDSMGGAVHVYAWDRPQLFFSADFKTPVLLDQQVKDQLVRTTIERLHGKPEEVVTKTTYRNEDWSELAPDILRQRAAITGQADKPISRELLTDYMVNLAGVLNMSKLSDPIIHEDSKTGTMTAWQHWETSGVIVNVHGDKVVTDIYTCKAFDPMTAVDYTRETLGLKPDLQFTNF